MTNSLSGCICAALGLQAVELASGRARVSKKLFRGGLGGRAQEVASWYTPKQR